MKIGQTTTITAALFLCFGLCFTAPSHSAQIAERVDLDGDGHREATIFFENGRIVKVQVDRNLDKKIDCVIYYKDGFRIRAERDANYDKKIDVWIKYYFTGMPWFIAGDKNFDGKPDHWRYLKNGFVYKREWDRNFDGKPDLRMLFEAPPDMRFVPGIHNRLVEIKEDNDFDGVFEKITRPKKKQKPVTPDSEGKIDITPGAIEETGV
ncbi:MAG: hypothetical protein HY593_04220 [Candidatus Omnitrophica bacterium]|nr:hypothetical protein [Candidatus Omnitrophota bacterium]